MRNLSLSKKVVVSVAVAVVLVVVLCFVAIASNYRIYNGISVAGVDLGGLTSYKATQKLEAEKFFEDLPPFDYEGIKFEVDPDQIQLKCDDNATADMAYEFGRSANVFVRVKNALSLMFNPVDLPIKVVYDKAELNKIFDEHLGDVRTPAVEPQFRLEDDKLYIINGNGGMDVNIEKFEAELARVATGDMAEIRLSIEPIEPVELSADMLRKEFGKEKADATYEISDKRITYTESQDGIDFDNEQVAKIIKENINNTEEYSIPIVITKADKTVDDIDEELFGDLLSTYTTKYNAGEIGRTKNVTLAANKINNIVLKKGETFSYNQIVGERTAERGFAGAKVYAGGEVVDGLGGGICQVSSTLYNAVLFADLQVVSRTEHSLPVTYVPLGRDATVSYGSIDFQFKNPHSNPIKITTSVGGGTLTVSIYGKKEEDIKVELSTETVSTLPFTVVEKPDETVAEGQTKVQQSGSNGAVVNTYKKVIKDGKVTSNKMIHTSRYNPINKIVLVNPAALEPQVTPEGEEVTPDAAPEGEEVTPDAAPEGEAQDPEAEVPSAETTASEVVPEANPDTAHEQETAE